MVAIVSLISGLLFGFGMVISGMVDSAKVLAFLDITGHWDPSLMFVMGGAVLVFLPGFHFLVKPMRKPVFDTEFFLPSKSLKIDRQLILGAALFGAGWGIAGLCPGPAVVQLSTLTPEILLFIGAMASGMGLVKVWQRVNIRRAAQPELGA